MSTPRTLILPVGVRRVMLETTRGPVAALEALPPTGAPQRLPALFVPGFTGSKEDFTAVLAPLARAGRLVRAIDMRGQYESPPAAGPAGYTPDALSADVAAVAMDAGQPCHLVGHSFGGLITRELAISSPGSLASFTLMCSGPGAVGGQRAEVLDWVLGQLRTVAPADLGAEIRRIWETLMEPEAVTQGVPDDILGFLRTRMMSNCPTGLMCMAQTLLTCPDRTEALAAAGAGNGHGAAALPMLVLYGADDDAWMPGIQEEMAQRLGARHVSLTGAGHSPAVENPDAVVRTLTEFWDAAESQSSARPSQDLCAGAAAAPSGHCAR
ncbi:MAG TPA: alpha/beta hydrolase [Streptosporangiaceae bacterium]|nr:alpha/beta hydrolase [Streptosporangiaceae bacterium]